jgi:hypothetical protein
MAARPEAPRADVRPLTLTAPARGAGLAWPRLPAVAELATIAAGYLGYALVRPAIHANRHIAERLSYCAQIRRHMSQWDSRGLPGSGWTHPRRR